MADNGLSAQDLQDLQQIRGMLPAGDARIGKIDALLGASAPAATTPADRLGGVDYIKAMAMKAMNESGKRMPMSAPVAPKAPTVPYSDPVNSALINVGAKVADLPGAIVRGSAPVQAYDSTKESINAIKQLSSGVPLSEVSRNLQKNPVDSLTGAAGINRQEVASDAANRDYGALAGDTAFPILMTLLGGKMARASKVPAGELVSEGERIRTQVVPKQVEKLTAALNPQGASDIPAALRRSLPAMNVVAKETGAQVGSVADFVNNVAKPTSTRLEGRYQSWIDPIRNQTIDAQPIKDAVLKEIKSHRPDAFNQQLTDWANNNIKSQYTIGELDELRKDLGGENKSYFGKDTVDKMSANRADPASDIASRAALKAVKDVLYSEIEKANPGQDVRGLKATQSALQKVIKQGENRSKFLDATQEKVAGRPKGRLGVKIIKDVANFKVGDAVLKASDAMRKKSFIVEDANRSASRAMKESR